MTIKELIEKYDFHDLRANEFVFNENDKSFEFLITNDIKGCKTKIKFFDVSNLKCLKDISKLDEYLLNIWQTKHSKNDVEIIFDDNEYTTIYLNAKSVEMIDQN